MQQPGKMLFVTIYHCTNVLSESKMLKAPFGLLTKLNIKNEDLKNFLGKFPKMNIFGQKWSFWSLTPNWIKKKDHFRPKRTIFGHWLKTDFLRPKIAILVIDSKLIFLMIIFGQKSPFLVIDSKLKFFSKMIIFGQKLTFF